MAIREYYGLTGRLTEPTVEHSPAIQVDGSLAGALEASGFVNGVDHTYFAVFSGGAYEIVKVIAVDATVLTVERGQTDEGSFPFPVGAEVQYVVTAQSVIEQLGPVETDVQISGAGIAGVMESDPNVFEVNVPVPEFEGENGIEIYGTYPQMRFSYTTPEGNCCGGGGSAGGGDGITEILGEGLVTAFVNGDIGTVRVTPPVFTAGANISVTGAWPNYTISATAGSGTVASVGVGAGLTLTGSPSVNPTISITNTGVEAGTYGGVNINARGQITTVPAGFNPISAVVEGTNVDVNRTGASVTISVPNAAVGAAGAVELADETDPFDPNDNTTAATPALVAVAMAAEQSQLLGDSSFSAETAAEYTNPIGTTTQALVLAAGETALVIAEVAALNTLTPTDPPNFGMAVFTSAGLLHGNRKFHQSQQQMSFVIEGPFNNTVTLTTTDLSTDATLLSHSMSVLVL